MALDFLPFAAAGEAHTELGRQMHDMLDGWQGEMAADAAQPLIFSAWYRELTRLIYADDLGANFSSGWWHRPTFTYAVMSGSLDDWCDDLTTEPVETCAELAGLAFDRAGVFLAARYGDDASAWRWGQAHMATFSHRLFGYLPILSDLTQLSLPVGGDRYTVNTGSYIFNDDDAVFTDIHGPSMRAVFDLADLDNSRFVWAPGQSGHMFSPYYDNMLTRWRDNDMVTIPASRNLIEVAHALTLEPPPTGD
jgi:penicillin amidase